MFFCFLSFICLLFVFILSFICVFFCVFLGKSWFFTSWSCFVEILENLFFVFCLLFVFFLCLFCLLFVFVFAFS